MTHSLIRCLAALVIVTVSWSAAAAAAVVERDLEAIVRADDPAREATSRGFAVRDDRIQIVALTRTDATDRVVGWLADHGATFIVPDHRAVQAFVPVTAVSQLGAHPEVVAVERPLYAHLPEPPPAAAAIGTKLLAETSEGLDVMNVPAWHAAGYTGAGVKVGVIDVEFGGWEDLLGVELPAAPRTVYRAFGGAGVVADQVHGTACAEIVHDVAPDADLYLAHIQTLFDFNNALNWFLDEGVDVVTMSVGWFGAGPGDGTGSTADRINSFVAAGDAVFFNSAGNERRSHWQGSTVDADGNDWVDFEPGDDLNELTFTMAAGDRVAVNIVWSDWESPASDYNLRLFNLDGAEPVQVAMSDRPQTGLDHQTPYEQISYTAPDGGRFGVRIGRSGVVGAHDMELFSADSDLDNRVAAGSLTIPTDTASVVGVAAISYNPPFGFRSFSSAGPTNGPGGTLTGGDTAPDLAAFDGVSTASYGPRSFFGTSAASPHAAGAAALVRSADPGLTGAEVRTFLEDRAQDLGAPGMDNDYGWGRLFLGPTPGSSCSYTIDPTEAVVPASGGGGIIRMTTDDGCPWTTSAMVDWITVAPPTGTGNGVIGYTVDDNPGDARTGEVIIAGLVFTVSQEGSTPPPEFRTMIAGIAETEGVAGTRWKSDLAILNPGDIAADVVLSYRHGGGSAQTSMTVAAGEIVGLPNVAAATFGVPDSAGAVEVVSSAPVIVTARTFNDSPDGTFGQSLPGVGDGDGLAPGEAAVLAQLGSDDDLRTNIGFVDLGGDGAEARIRLYDGDGDPVGSELRQPVAPGGWAQLNKVFRKAGAGDCRGCYALVDLVGDDGPVWAYASVVDNASGDPTTIPMTRLDASSAAGDTRYLVAGIAETGGAAGTRWKSDLALLNLAGTGATADLTYRHEGGAETTSVTLADGELREFPNTAAGLFGAPDTAGLVDVAADAVLVITARTFNDAPDGTFGQFLPGIEEGAALAAQQEGFLTQLASDDVFRTNIGYVNFDDAECSVRTTLYDGAGVMLRTYVTAVPPGEWVQSNRVFNGYCPAGCSLGYAVVKGVDADCRIWAYASVVDNGSGDPTTVPVVSE